MDQTPRRKGLELQQGQMEEEIDLMEVMRVLLGRAWLILLAFVLGALLAGIGTKLFITPRYTASSTIYVFSKSSSNTSAANIQLSNQLTTDFQIIATTRETINQVIDELGLEPSYYKQLVGSISVTNPEDSHMLTIRVQDPDPQRAAQVANALADVLREQIADVMNTDKPSTVSRAVVPESPSSPSMKRNVVLGGLALAALVVAVVLIRYFADDTISTEEDIRRYLNLTVLASVPFEKNIAK